MKTSEWESKMAKHKIVRLKNAGAHIHTNGCVYCGDPKICSKCMQCPCRINKAEKELRLARMGRGWLDVCSLDVLIDNGYTVDQLIGVNVDWHGRKAVVVKRPGGLQKISVALTAKMPCRRGCGRRLTITVKSGVHHGSFCTVIDRNGNRLADLRDHIMLCGECR